MRNLTILLALIFTVMFSSTSFAEWKKVDEGVSGTTYYVDFERIRKVDGYVYWWGIGNRLTQTPTNPNFHYHETGSEEESNQEIQERSGSGEISPSCG